MVEILSLFPGQIVTVFLETLDANGVRTDGYIPPVVTRIIFPELTLAGGYPQNMIKLDTGLFYFKFTLPTGGSAVGSYLIDVEFLNPANGFINNQTYQVVVTAPFGNFSASVAVSG